MKTSLRVLSTLALIAAPVGVLGGASAAPPTATTVGEVSPVISVTCVGPATLIQGSSRPGAPSYDMPFDGVITSFSTRTNSSDKTARLVMFQQLTPSTFAVKAKTSAMPTLNGVVNTFSVRVPVKAGWKIGATLAAGCGHSGSGADALHLVTAGDVDTDPVVTTNSVGPFRVNIGAQLEPDVDGDGYGDVSQDACPDSALSVVTCPAPDTSITKAPKAKSKKRKVTVEFASTVSRSSFMVSVDGKAAKEYFSPFKATLKPGKHTITVQAVTPAGIVDPTPATTTFKIKKPKRRH